MYIDYKGKSYILHNKEMSYKENERTHDSLLEKYLIYC